MRNSRGAHFSHVQNHMRPKFNKREREEVLKKTQGTCFHCKKVLEGTWHCDHHPVLWRDVEDQACWGVRDGKDLSNVVPACVECNCSHKYERTPYCCGRYSQPRCRQSYLIRTLGLLFAGSVGYALGCVFG